MMRLHSNNTLFFLLVLAATYLLILSSSSSSSSSRSSLPLRRGLVGGESDPSLRLMPHLDLVPSSPASFGEISQQCTDVQFNTMHGGGKNRSPFLFFPYNNTRDRLLLVYLYTYLIYPVSSLVNTHRGRPRTSKRSKHDGGRVLPSLLCLYSQELG